MTAASLLVSSRRSPQPIDGKLTRLDPSQVRASRLVFDARMGRLIPAGLAASATWRDAARADGDRTSARAALRFAGAGGSVGVIVELEPGSALRQVLDPALPPVIQKHLLQLSTQAVDRWLEPLGLANLQAVEARHLSESAAEDGPQLEVQWAADETAKGRFSLAALDAAASRALQARLDQKTFGLTRYRGLRLRGRFAFGRRTLPVAQADTLCAGDVLMPESSLDGSVDIRGRVHFGDTPHRHWRADAVCSASLITLQRKPGMVNGLKTGGSESAPGESPSPLLEMSVPISFEIETASLTLAELETVEAGYVFELPVPVKAATVRLSVYGNLIGLGELVSVGEQLGVRILRIGASHAISTGP